MQLEGFPSSLCVWRQAVDLETKFSMRWTWHCSPETINKAIHGYEPWRLYSASSVLLNTSCKKLQEERVLLHSGSACKLPIIIQCSTVKTECWTRWAINQIQQVVLKRPSSGSGLAPEVDIIGYLLIPMACWHYLEVLCVTANCSPAFSKHAINATSAEMEETHPILPSGHLCILGQERESEWSVVLWKGGGASQRKGLLKPAWSRVPQNMESALFWEPKSPLTIWKTARKGFSLKEGHSRQEKRA